MPRPPVLNLKIYCNGMWRNQIGCAQGHCGCYSLADQIFSSCPSGFGIKLTRYWPSPKQWSRRPVVLGATIIFSMSRPSSLCLFSFVDTFSSMKEDIHNFCIGFFLYGMAEIGASGA